MDRTVYYAETCSNYSEESTNSPRPAAQPPPPPNITTNKPTNNSNFNRVRINTAAPKSGSSKQAMMGRAITEKLHHQKNNKQPNNNSVTTKQVNNPHQAFVYRTLHNNMDKLADRPLTRHVVNSGISRIGCPPLHSSLNKTENSGSGSSNYPTYNYGSVLVLHLQCKNITTMTPSALDPFYNLKNLYLYKNRIRRIQGLDNLTNLELLDLSRNNVERIDGLHACVKLKKLYLGFNEIQVVEGLDHLTQLEELLIDDQDIPPEQPLIFIPGVLDGIVHSLVQLDISSNQLASLHPISDLHMLHSLVASNNLIDDLEETLAVLETLPQLHNLDLKGNPIASRPTYRTKIIGATYKLECLDGKDIPETTRTCVQRLRMLKQTHAARKKEQQRVVQQQTQQSHPSPYHLDPNYSVEFNFSTPTRQSPIQPKISPKTTRPPVVQAATSQQFLDQSAYESTARSNSSCTANPTSTTTWTPDQMSDMAKIIFRLSNLDDPSAAVPMDGSGDHIRTFHSSYWDQPGSSMTPECRALSPLEGDPVLDKLKPRPKPAGPGGRSNNTTTLAALPPPPERYVYGRTLSPLIELPTPESLTAREHSN